MGGDWGRETGGLSVCEKGRKAERGGGRRGRQERDIRGQLIKMAMAGVSGHT